MTEKVRVSSVDEFESGTARQVELGSEKVAVIRVDDTFYAIGDRCSHADYSLSEGEVDCEHRTIECWKHGSEFRLTDGRPETMPATQPVPVYAVDVVDGEVFVSLPGERS